MTPAPYVSYLSSMAILPIVQLPDAVLRQFSTPVQQVDAAILKLADNMLETMYAAPGVGLAAIQVGVPKRLIVLDTAGDNEPKKPLVVINPEIVRLGPELRTYEEGCLSIPDVRVEIERPSTVIIRYVDREGRQQQLDADGLLATAIQHEVDHLDGKLIVDFLTRLKRDIVIRKLKKISRG